jgi:amino acid transporter
MHGRPLRTLIRAIAFGVSVTVVLFTLGILSVTQVMPTAVGTITEALLKPGAWLPEWYWGALHDPLQFLIAVVLDFAFYTAIGILFSCSSRSPGRLV